HSAPVTATVSASARGCGTATATVQSTDRNTVLDTEALAAGSATFTTSALSVAGHSISVVYSGDGNFTTSTGTLTQTINQDGTTKTRSATSSATVYAQALARAAQTINRPAG